MWSGRYLIAADGARNSVREVLGIGMTGHDISAEINVLFEADLSRALGGKRAILYRLRNRWLSHGGVFRNIDGRNRWTMFTRDFDGARPARIAEIIRGCAGDPELPVEVLATGVWQKAALLAVRPDGYVAWRRPEACDDMTGELTRAMSTVLSRAQTVPDRRRAGSS